mmetsp:Transcript_3513/g.14549  ORF Transcript_3513/g.14549 Transcript_3513/m.14549 type:complete len:272 (+) Transcript_3513:82-897(+)
MQRHLATKWRRGQHRGGASAAPSAQRGAASLALRAQQGGGREHDAAALGGGASCSRGRSRGRSRNWLRRLGSRRLGSRRLALLLLQGRSEARGRGGGLSLPCTGGGGLGPCGNGRGRCARRGADGVRADGDRGGHARVRTAPARLPGAGHSTAAHHGLAVAVRVSRDWDHAPRRRAGVERCAVRRRGELRRSEARGRAVARGGAHGGPGGGGPWVAARVHELLQGSELGPVRCGSGGRGGGGRSHGCRRGRRCRRGGAGDWCGWCGRGGQP